MIFSSKCEEPKVAENEKQEREMEVDEATRSDC